MKTCLCLSIIFSLSVVGVSAQTGIRTNQNSSSGAQATNPHLVELNGGLEAEITKMGRSRGRTNLTVTIRLANTGPNVAYLLILTGPGPVATDNTGSFFRLSDQVSGVATCRGTIESSQCVGLSRWGLQHALPLQSFTKVDPGRQIFINLTLVTGAPSEGPLISLSTEFYCRFVSDPGRDATLPDSDKYKQFQLISVGFPAITVTDAN